MSVVVTLVTALVGIGFGLFSGSAAVVFDGVYSLADAAMTLLALGVARLIAASNAADASGGRLHQRFTMGFWHLEPIVLGVNGALLTGAAIYAFVNALGGLLSGGQPLAFDAAMIYAGVATVAQVSMAVYVARANRTIGSRLVALDAQAWVMTSALSLALFVAFLIGYLIQGTPYAWMAPYVDPAALMVISLAIIPVPLGTMRDALADILLMTPQDLRNSVDRTAADVVERYGFLSYRAYVARVGRGTQIELHFIAPPAWPAKTLEEWDALREEIGAALGETSADRWLTIAFTTRPDWAA